MNFQAIWDHEPPKPKAGSTLLARMGGVDRLHDFVYGFYDRILADKLTAPSLVKSQATQSIGTYMKLIKDRTVEYLEIVWGGDKWEGQDFFVLHAQLHINAQVYDKCIKLGALEVKKMKFPSDVAKDIMQEIELMKEPITDSDGKFHRWVADKQKAMETNVNGEDMVDPTGMGFMVSKAEMQRIADKEQGIADRKIRMAAQKAKREAEEKEQKQQKRDGKKSNETAKSDSEPPSPTKSAKGEPASHKKAQGDTTKGKENMKKNQTVKNEPPSKTQGDASPDKVVKNGTTAARKQSPRKGQGAAVKDNHAKAAAGSCETGELAELLGNSDSTRADDAEAQSFESGPDLPMEDVFVCIQDSRPTPLPGLLSKV
jgi:hypothetical protein